MSADDRSDLGTQVANARSQMTEFEQLLLEARTELLGRNFPAAWVATMLRDDEFFRWHLIRDFFDPYIESGVYPLERLPKTAYWLMDIELERYLLVNSLMPIHNHSVFGKEGFTLANPRVHPATYMHHLALTQAMIGAVRILWERLMSLIYYLETGKNAQQKGSVRKAFFRSIEDWGDRWRPIKEWKSELGRYDDLYRTPEFHNNSRLRAGIFKNELPDPNEIIGLVDPVSGFWQLLTANIRGVSSGVMRLGGQVSSFDRMDAAAEGRDTDPPRGPGPGSSS